MPNLPTAHQHRAVEKARLDRASTALTAALTMLPSAGEPGYPTPTQLAAGLAEIIRLRCDPMERQFIASAAMMALDAYAAEALAEALLHDIREPVTALDSEAARQTEVWRRHCARSSYRNPPLTRAEQRRAEAINGDDDPRTRLAEAVREASDRDLRDLVARLTGRAWA